MPPPKEEEPFTFYVTGRDDTKPKTTKPAVANDVGTLKQLSDAIDRIGVPFARNVDAFTGGANYGAFGELGPYVSAIPQGKMPSTIRAERDQMRKEMPKTFQAGDMAGTVGRDMGIVAATGGAGAPLAWLPTLARGTVAGTTSGVLNEATKFAPEAIRAGEDYDVGSGLLRTGANSLLGAFGAATGKVLGQGFTGTGRVAGARGTPLTDAELAAAERQIRASRSDPRYGLRDTAQLNAAEAMRAGTAEAPTLAEPAAALQTILSRAGAKASDNLGPAARSASEARAAPGGFMEQQARARAQQQTAEQVADATLGTAPVIGARGPGFTPERQMFTEAARLNDPTIPAQAYPIVKETIQKSLHPDEAAAATAAVGRLSPAAARQHDLENLIRNFDRYGKAMKGPVSNKAIAEGAPSFPEIGKSAGSTVGAAASIAANIGNKLSNPAYASAERLIHNAPEEALRLIGRNTQGSTNIAGVVQGLIDAVLQQNILRPKKPQKQPAY